MRELPFASQGFVKEPGPEEPVGQSCCGSGALDATGGALVGGAGADADATGALAEGDGAGAASSFEQATRARSVAVVRRAFRMRRIVVPTSAAPGSDFSPGEANRYLRGFGQ
jgi:hypothetical protein